MKTRLTLCAYLGLLPMLLAQSPTPDSLPPAPEPAAETDNSGNDLTGSKLSGDIQTIANFFVRDSSIGAANTPQYDRQKFGTTSWVTLNYRNWGFDIGLRFDAFNNSNIIDPLDSYTALGIGRWHVRKAVGKLDITAGYIYDQIGTGAIFRAYENRMLAIDNALVGARFIYNINTNWSVKGFAGKQKKVEKQPSLSENYQPIIAGAAVDGFVQLADEFSWVLGAGVVRRTLDDETMNTIVQDISSYVPADKFIPKYTTYVYGGHSRLTYKNFEWFGEAAFKTAEAVNVQRTDGVLENRAGSNLLTSLAYSQKGLSIMGTYKRTDHFIFRTSPLQILNRGQIAFLPSMARQNTYRLTARYNAATQELGEQAQQLDIMYSPTRKLQFLLNVSNIQKLDNTLLYREMFVEALYKYKNKWKLSGGLQLQLYNQEVMLVKPGKPNLKAIVPFGEFNYKINNTMSFRIEASYMHTEEDYGSWAYGLVELNIAPHWSFSVSDMVNVVPKFYSKINHFYAALVSYTVESTMLGLSYVRQVEGIVCTGGVCRYEPAFNGAKVMINSRF